MPDAQLSTLIRLTDALRQYAWERGRSGAQSELVALAATLTRQADVLGYRSLATAVDAFVQHPTPETIDHVLEVGMRVCLPGASPSAPALCLIQDERAADQVTARLAQVWVSQVRFTSAADAWQGAMSASPPPSAAIVEVGDDPAEALRLIRSMCGDIHLRRAVVLAFGPADSEVRNRALAAGAIQYIRREQLATPLLGALLRGIYGVVEGTSLVALDDVRTRLPTREALAAETRAAIEDYSTFRVPGWVLVGVEVIVDSSERVPARHALMQRAVERLRAIAPPDSVFGTLGSTRFALLIRKDVPSAMLSELANPAETLGEMLNPGLPPLNLRLAAISGGVIRAEDALRELGRALARAEGGDSVEARGVGSERVGSVLIVEDDPVAARLIDIVLRRMGMAPVWKKDGAAGLAELRAAPASYAAVVLDLQVPRMSGFEVLETLQTDAALREIPVLILTGSVETRDESLALEHGAADFIQKPVTPDVLMARMRRLLRGGRVGRGDRSPRPLTE